MQLTRKMVADKLVDYLEHRISLPQVVDWAEQQLMDGEFDPTDHDAVRDVVARIGVADVRAFGLTWEDCERLLALLGFNARVEITVA